jgi:hypothetical protein
VNFAAIIQVEGRIDDAKDIVNEIVSKYVSRETSSQAVSTEEHQTLRRVEKGYFKATRQVF